MEQRSGMSYFASDQVEMMLPSLLVRTASMMKISKAMEKHLLVLPTQNLGFRFKSGLFLIKDSFSLVLFLHAGGVYVIKLIQS